jgi:hypothetical protein
MSRIEDALIKASQKRQTIEIDRMIQAELPSKSGSAIGKLRWWHFGGIFLFLALGFVVSRFYESGVIIPEKPKPVTADAVVKSRPAEIKAATLPAPRLPSSIPLQSLDPAYSSTHPGWERYAADSLEFRVFRKESTVKAIQVLTQKDNVITDSFVTSFLAEFAGRDLFKVHSGEEKGGYFIERGTAGNKADVAVYRKGPTGKIRAFVVAYL